MSNFDNAGRCLRCGNTSSSTSGTWCEWCDGGRVTDQSGTCLYCGESQSATGLFCSSCGAGGDRQVRVSPAEILSTDPEIQDRLVLNASPAQILLCAENHLMEPVYVEGLLSGWRCKLCWPEKRNSLLGLLRGSRPYASVRRSVCEDEFVTRDRLP